MPKSLSEIWGISCRNQPGQSCSVLLEWPMLQKRWTSPLWLRSYYNELQRRHVSVWRFWKWSQSASQRRRKTWQELSRDVIQGSTALRVVGEPASSCPVVSVSLFQHEAFVKSNYNNLNRDFSGQLFVWINSTFTVNNFPLIFNCLSGFFRKWEKILFL